MSTETDKIQKLVEIRLQKDDFEQGLEETTKSLEKFEAKLNFEGSEKGLETLGQSMLKLPLDGITSGVKKLGEEFSTAGVYVKRMIENFADSTWNNFVKTLKSFTIDPLTSGWEKYESKTKSVQTIMSATRKEFEGVGNQMEIVEGQLDRLTRFTDETSHKFTDMVGNIGKFTANGAKLEDAVTAMQGIATWASLSGGHIQEASRAMYNLSQAMGVGALKTMDWKSIELANMATAEFKETAIQTAVELGTLKKVSNDLWKDMKGNEVTVNNFRETLKSGWLDTNVLIGTLKKYGEFADKLLGYMEEMDDVTVQKMLRAIEAFKKGALNIDEFAKSVGISGKRAHEILQELSKDEYDLGRRAFKASFETRTFKEALEYVSEAVGSSWMKTWEIIFGNYEKAKDLWSEFSEWLYEVFVMPGETRNDLLKEWADDSEGGLNGRAVLIQGLRDALASLKLILDNVKDAWRSVFPETTAQMLMNVTNKFANGMARIKNALQFVRDGFDNFKNGVDGVKAGVESVTKPVETATDAITEFAKTVIMGKYGNNPDRQNTLEGMGLSFGVIQNEVNRLLDCSYRYEVTQEDIAKTSAKLAEINGTVAESVDEVAESIQEINYSDLTIGEKLNKSLRGLFSFVAILQDTWKGLMDGFIKPVLDWALPKIIGGILTFTAKAGDSIVDFREKFLSLGDMTEFFHAGFEAIPWFFGAVSDWFKSVKESLTSGSLESVNKAVGYVKNFINAVSGIKAKVFEGLINAFNGIKKALTGTDKVQTSLSFIDILAKSFNYIVELTSPFTNALAEITNSFLDWFKALDFSKIGDVFGGIKQFFSDIWNSSAFDGIKGAFASLKDAISNISGSEVVSSVLSVLSNAFTKIIDISRPITTAISSIAHSFLEWFKALDFSRFGGIFDRLKQILKDIWEFVKNIASGLSGNINFSGIFDWISGKASGLTSLTSMTGLFSRFTGIFDRFKTALSSSGKAVGDFTVNTQKLGATTKAMLGTHGIFDPILEQLGPIGEKLKKIGEVIKEAFKNLNLESLLGYIKSGATLFALVNFGKVLGSISTSTLLLGKVFIDSAKIWDAIASVPTALANFIASVGTKINMNITTITDGIETLVKSTKRNNTVKQVLMIAAAVAALAGSVWLIATQVPPEKLWSAVGAVSALVITLGIAVALLSKANANSATGKFDATLLAGAIVGFAAAVLLLIGAMKILEGVEDFKSAYLKVVSIVALLGIIVAAIAFINKDSKILSGANTALSLLGILFFAAAVKKVVEALILLTGSDIDKLRDRMPILIGIIAATVFVAMLAKAVGKFGGSFTLIGIILSIWVFVKALKSMANEDWGMLYATMMQAIGLIGILMVFIGFLSLLNDAVPNGSHLEQPKIAGALIGFGVAMLAMAAAMKIVETIDEGAYNRCLFAVGLMGVILAGFAWVARKGDGKHVAQLAVAFIGLSVLLLTMVGCVWLLSKIAKDKDKMWEGIKAIFVLMLAISVFTYATKYSTKSTGVLVALTVMVTMLSLAIVALAMLPTENALAAAIGLGLVFLAFSQLLKQLGTLGQDLGKTSLVILLMAGLIVAIGAIIWWMNENIKDPSGLIPIMESIGGLLLAVAGVTWILQYVNGIAAIKGAAGMAGVIAVIAFIGAIAAGLQWLFETKLNINLFGAIEKGLDILVIIARKIGEAIAAFGEGATSRGEEVGKNLSKFAEAITPFMEFLKSDYLTPDAVSNLGTIQEFINTLNGMAIDPTLFQTLEGTDTTAVGKSFTELASGIQSYAEALSGVTNWDSVDKASRVIEALGTITVPGYQPQWATFLVGASEFATSLVNMVGILNEASFTKGDAMKMEWFAEAARSLAQTGTSVKAVGQVEWSKFTVGLNDMVTEIKKVAASMAIITADDARTDGMSYLIDITGKLVELENAMRPQGGVVDEWWNGAANWTTFATGLKDYATTIKDTGIRGYWITDAAKQGIQNIIDITGKLVDLQATLPTVAGEILGLFIENKGNWVTFGEGLAEYGVALKTFGESCTDVNQTDADKALALSTKLVGLSTQDFNSVQLYQLGGSIQSFGENLKSFYTNTADYSSELGGIVQNIVNAFTGDMSAIAQTNLTSIGESIAVLSTTGINNNSSLFGDSGHASADVFFRAMWDEISAAKAKNAGSMMMNYVREAFNSFYEFIIGDGNTTADKFLYGISQKNEDAKIKGKVLQTLFREGLNDYDQEFYNAGIQAAQGFVNGTKDSTVQKNAKDAGKELAEKVLEGTKEKMQEHSPSKAMFELGSYGAEGFILGLQNWFRVASDTGSALGDNAMDGLRSTISLISEAISSDLDTEPVITPVLDLSRVSAGARVLNGLVNSNPIVGANRFTLNSTPQNEGENTISGGVTFVQNNYSPKALSRSEIYRQTRNQISVAKGLVEA